jgi:hypothetical protein
MVFINTKPSSLLTPNHKPVTLFCDTFIPKFLSLNSNKHCIIMYRSLGVILQGYSRFEETFGHCRNDLKNPQFIHYLLVLLQCPKVSAKREYLKGRCRLRRSHIFCNMIDLISPYSDCLIIR